MAYDQNDDQTVKEWKTGDNEGDLIFAIKRYKNGQPKLAILKNVKTKDRGMIQVPHKRLSWEDVQILKDKLPEIIQKMDKVK